MPQRFAQNKVLGLTVGERSLVVAEASRTGGAPRVTLAATFAYPAGVSLDTPADLGKALAAFLKEKGFGARHAAVGLPARWVLSKAKELPPSDAATAAESLRLQVEGEFSGELKDLTFDYAGDPSASEARGVLLLAVQSKRIDAVQAMLAAADLKPAGIAPAAVVLGAATTAPAVAGGKPRSTLVVSVGPAGVELAAQDGLSVRALRHLGPASASPAVLAGELRRAAFAVTAAGAAFAGDVPFAAEHRGGDPKGGDGRAAGVAAPANGNGHANGANGSNGANGGGATTGRGPALVLFDGAVWPEQARRILADAASARVETGDLSSLGVPDGMAAVGGGHDLAGAAALAVAVLGDLPLPADFLRSKLAEPPRSRFSRQQVIAAGVVAAVVLIALLMFVDLWSKNRTLANLKAENEANAAKVKEATAFNERVRFLQGWRTGQPVYLACVKEFLTAVPEDGKTYVLSLALQTNMAGSAQVRSDTQDSANVTSSALRDNPRFKDVRVKRWTLEGTGGRGAQELGYIVDFVFVPQPTAPATKPTTGR